VYLLYVTFPVFKTWRQDPFIFKNQFFMAILHLFSIKIAQEPCLTDIVSQIIINLDKCCWDHRLLIFNTKTDFCLAFRKFKYPVSQSRGFDLPCSTSFFISHVILYCQINNWTRFDYSETLTYLVTSPSPNTWHLEVGITGVSDIAL
jgi:hypothetical protein